MRPLGLVMVAACGASSPEPVEGPRAIRTEEHLEAARKHDEIARQRSTFPVRTETVPGDPSSNLAPIVPWTRTWEPESDHARLVRIHRSEAAAREAELQQACAGTDAKAAGSPLTRHRVGGWETEEGVVVLLGRQAGTPESLLADLRCQRAYQLAGVGVDRESPLALPGLEIAARGDQDGIELTLTVQDPQLLPELRRRVAAELEELRRPSRHEQ